MYLNKYVSKKRLGKGAYGDVHLVEDQKGDKYALKIIAVSKFQGEQEYMRDYLDGQIECMKEMDSPHTIKLYDVQEDKDYIYLILEYCDLGDLVNYQAKINKQMVFPLDKATEVLSQVILGLQELHKHGYLHRDIKSQNVLAKKEGDKEIFKLADFGFSKKSNKCQGTILGTEQYMSPEIFRGDEEHTYGFEVDMWAFGVLFYFMLNLEFPFKLNPYLPPEKKERELTKLAAKFSYAAAVKKTRRKKMENCSSDMEDLFSRIFDIDPNKRITFFQIRNHPIFASRFPNNMNGSKVLYSRKFMNKLAKRNTMQNNKDLQLGQNPGETRRSDIRGQANVGKKQSTKDEKGSPAKEQNHSGKTNSSKKDSKMRKSVTIANVDLIGQIMREINKDFPFEKQTLERRRDESNILKHSCEFYLQCRQFLEDPQILMIAHELMKEYAIVLKDMRKQLDIDILNEVYPRLKWGRYVQTKQYADFVQEIEDEIKNNRLKYVNLCHEVETQLDKIHQLNNKFAASYREGIDDAQRNDTFCDSFRRSTAHIFSRLNQQLRMHVAQGNKLPYGIVLLLFAHGYEVFRNPNNQTIIFKNYLTEKNKGSNKLDYLELRSWLSSSNENVLTEVINLMLKAYFG